jgi:outer membrane protein TolC
VKLSDEPATLARRSATGDVPHPQVESLEAAARASALDARAARRAAVPDIRLFGGYRMLNSGSDTGHGFALGLSLPLTFFDHGQGSARRADAKRTMAEARSQRLQRDNRARRLAASARERALADSSERLDRAIKLALEVRGNAERLYLAAEGSLLAVLAAHNRVAALKLARIEIGASAARARLDAMAASGRLGDPATDVACGASRP